MHYYKRNLGDYAKKAGRLSMLEHGAYTLLLDACYDRERFPTEDEAIEWAWSRSQEEIEAVRFVLSRFFERQDDGRYVQRRIDEELRAFKAGELINRLIALSREAKKQKRNEFASACDELRAKIKHDPLAMTHAAWSEVVEELVKEHAPCTPRAQNDQKRAPNQEPRTTNQEPETNLKDEAGPHDDAPVETPEEEKTRLAREARSARKKSIRELISPFFDEKLWQLFDNRKRKKVALDVMVTKFFDQKDAEHEPLLLVMEAALHRERRWRNDVGVYGDSPRGGYRPNGGAAPQQDPERWIRNECWNDEIPESTDGTRQGDAKHNGFNEIDYSVGIGESHA